MSNMTAKIEKEESKSDTSNKQTTSKEPVENNGDMQKDFSATTIATAWRYHRKTREERGKILSASSRDMIFKKGGGKCLHLPGQPCPVWSQWEELLEAVEEQMRRKEIHDSPPSSSQKFELAMTVVKGIAKGSNSAQDHLWLILDTEHWLEICDKKHRYGSNLKVYHDHWIKNVKSQDNFFDWLDGSAKELSLEARPRELLENQQVKYLTKKEREEHEVIFKDGLLIYLKDGRPVHTNPPDPDLVIPVDGTNSLSIPRSLSPAPSSQGSINEINEENEDLPSNVPTRHGSTDETLKREKWIYVTDCDGKFYVGQKIKGHFHHSSFLAGGAIRAAGGIKVREGKLLEINPNSGHYKPAQHHFKALISRLESEGIDLGGVKVVSPNENLEKRLIAKYKYKRLALLSIACNEIVTEASGTINQKIDSMDRQVSIFKKSVIETLKACKDSIKEWIRRMEPENNNDNNDKDQQNGLVD